MFNRNRLKMHIVKYWQRISTFSNDNILRQAYMENIELNKYNKRRWVVNLHKNHIRK